MWNKVLDCDPYETPQAGRELSHGAYLSVAYSNPVGVYVCPDGKNWWVSYRVSENFLPQRFDICCGEAIKVGHEPMRTYDNHLRRFVIIHNYHAYVLYGERGKEYNHAGKMTRRY